MAETTLYDQLQNNWTNNNLPAPNLDNLTQASTSNQGVKKPETQETIKDITLSSAASPQTKSTVKVETVDGEIIEMDKLTLSDLTPSGVGDDQKTLYHGINTFAQSEFTKGIFTHRYRYGVLNPYQSLTTAREILFFTKPELNLFNSGSDAVDSIGVAGDGVLNPVLEDYPFFTELNDRYPEVLYALQNSAHNPNNDPFNHLLGNMVQSNLDVPSTTADMIETPANVYGVSYKYRGSSEAGDDNHSFSLEFKDTKYLPVYSFFKAYDLYEILKHHGIVRPNMYYISNKILHDQYAIYKFILDEDMETIIYYAKYYGVKSVNLPRDVFNTTSFDNGLSYSIDFDAAFVEDMNPQILLDFNSLSYNYWKSLNYHVNVYDLKNNRVDMRAANSAVVVRMQSGKSGYQVLGAKEWTKDQGSGAKLLHSVPGGVVYKLRWKGDQKV